MDDLASLSSLADFRDSIANIQSPEIELNHTSPDKIIKATVHNSITSNGAVPNDESLLDNPDAPGTDTSSTPVITAMDPETTVSVIADASRDLITKEPPTSSSDTIRPENGIPLDVFEPTIKKTLDNLVSIIDSSMTTNKLDSSSVNFLEQMRTLNASIPRPVPLTPDQNIVLVNRLAIDLFHTFKNIKDDVLDIPSLTKAQKKAILNSVVTHSLNLLGDFDSVMTK